MYGTINDNLIETIITLQASICRRPAYKDLKHPTNSNIPSIL